MLKVKTYCVYSENTGVEILRILMTTRLYAIYTVIHRCYINGFHNSLISCICGKSEHAVVIDIGIMSNQEVWSQRKLT